jgi:hypothetical protein
MSIVRIVGNYFVINPNLMEKPMTPAFERSKAVERLERLAFACFLVPHT